MHGTTRRGCLAGSVTLTDETVRSAVTERIDDPALSADRVSGIDRGVEGTPTVFVDGTFVGWTEIASEPVRDAIESARAR